MSIQSKNEMLLNAGLNWTVSARPVYDNEGRELAGYRAITRDDTGHVFCVSSARYHPLQNSELAGVAESLCGTGGAFFHRAHSFRDGARVSFRLAVPDANFELGAGDRIETYILCSTSHDGSAAVSLIPYARRLVCENGMTRIIGEKARAVSVRHIKSGAERLRIDAAAILGEEIQRFKLFHEKAARLASKEMSAAALDSFLDQLFEKDKESETVRGLARRHEIAYLFKNGRGNAGRTAWDAFNAVTEYNSHYRAGSNESRGYGLIYGAGAELEERAASLLLV